ncbi:AraC family transcriptional regulator [Paenibacillus kandeliae]|uniref:AraC family transcriptional regulator n=1 Tax=Paenibacillus kandeliae TaxID=3231269 RepID=UPI003458A913
MISSYADIDMRLHELVCIMLRHAPEDGVYETMISGVRLRHTTQITQPVHSIASPSLYIIAQGSKTVTLANQTYHYDPLHYLVNPVHLPVIGRIEEASIQKPYLSLQLDFDMDMILDLVKPRPEPAMIQHDGGLFIDSMTSDVLDAASRLLRLLDHPTDIDTLAPLIIREILYRVLQGEQGAIFAYYAVTGSYINRILQVVDHINQHYDQPLNISQMAKEVHMSAATLHKYFKQATAMSPIQYQKTIRLQTARRLLLGSPIDAAEAGFQVGYESPSQFSREYARMFGLPPKSDSKQQAEFLIKQHYE